MHKNKKYNFWWFLVGLGYKLQVFASLSISEVIVVAIAPFLFFRCLGGMKRHGILPLFYLSLLVFLGCVVACLSNGTEVDFALRGVAATTITSLSIVVAYWLLTNAPNGFKWFLVGWCISNFLCTFAFQNIAEVRAVGSTEVSDIVTGPLYWISRLNSVFMLPIKGWYLNLPIAYSILTPIAFAGFAMITSSSGRSAALGAIGFSCMVLLGGKKVSKMRRLSKHFIALCIAAIVGIEVLSLGYKYMAINGLLSERSVEKFERQTQGDTSVKRLLLGGRMESFVGLVACFEKPLVGWGPWVEDTNGYHLRFLEKYGTEEDYRNYKAALANQIMIGTRRIIIQCHSHITEFWLWYGVFGLIFWIYVIFLLIRYIKDDCWAVPQWFGWLACSVPSMLWGIFFGVYSDRIAMPLFFVACLLVRAVRLGTFELPVEMQEEIRKAWYK